MTFGALALPRSLSQAVTDDDIMDEAAGAATITMAAESKARKAKEVITSVIASD